MDTRSLHRNEFVNISGWAKAKSKIIAGDASNRSYERLTNTSGKTAILMNAPPDKGEDVRSFIKIIMTNIFLRYHILNTGFCCWKIWATIYIPVFAQSSPNLKANFIKLQLMF